MAKTYGNFVSIGGGGGQNADLPPLLDSFQATYGDTENTVILSAEKMQESRAKELAGAVWVYGDHVPQNVNDGTKIQLTKSEVTRPDEDPSITLGDIPASDASSETLINLRESDGKLHPYIYLMENYNNSGHPLLLRKNISVQQGVTGGWGEGGGTYYQWCNDTFLNTILDSSVSKEIPTINISAIKVSNSQVGIVPLKVFALSVTEYGLVFAGGPVEGSAIPYFSSNQRRIAYLDGGGAVAHYTRTTVTASMSYITTTGDKNFEYTPNTVPHGLRPAFCLPLTFKIKAIQNEDGSYDMHEGTSTMSTFASSEFTVQKSVSWENTKGFYARQFTYNSKKQYQTMLEGAVASPNKIPEGQPITNLNLKDKIKIGKYNNNILKWIISGTGTDLAISMEGASAIQIGMKSFDSSGSNRYINSDAHEWLNAINSMENGFLSQWSEDEIGILKNETWVARKANSLGGGTETFEARVVLHSASEIGLSTGDGTLLGLFNDVSYRKIGASWWTRSPQSTTTMNVGYVDGTGALYYLAATGNAYIRPLCKLLTQGVYVSDKPDADGYYTITGVVK